MSSSSQVVSAIANWDTGERTPGIMIQAEAVSGQKIVGFVVLADQSYSPT